MKKILFCTPNLNRTGSEIALFNIMQHLDRENFEYSILTLQKGELLLNKKLKPTNIYIYSDYQKKKHKLLKRIINRIFGNFNNNLLRSFFEHTLDEYKPDLCIFNTLITSELLEFTNQKNVYKILYVHEMDWTYSFFSASQLRNMIEIPDLVICCSEISKSHFMKLGRRNNIEVVYPGIDFSEIQTSTDQQILRKKLGIPDGAFVWGMSGTLDRNKNPLLFVQLAFELLVKEHSNCFFIWIGGNKQSGDCYYAEQVAKNLGIQDRILFTGALKEAYYDYLNLLDGFVLTSQNDSFPLVLLESFYLGKPIVGLNSGGISELKKITDGCIYIAFDVDELILLMMRVTNSPSSRFKVNDKISLFSSEQASQNFINKLITDITQRINFEN
ncbi:MAG: glycosyltransferase [Sediminibacterium sp.]